MSGPGNMLATAAIGPVEIDKQLVLDRGSTLMDLHGVGPSGAAKLLADIGDVHRFVCRDRFASWIGAHCR
ncbi:transposase [Nocardia sp. NPDC050710]|uniref:transposase n=1 Tax=Nocardia sp. NPDC050710 TaxID=3157220 RepID=UPI00340D49DB